MRAVAVLVVVGAVLPGCDQGVEDVAVQLRGDLPTQMPVPEDGIVTDTGQFRRTTSATISYEPDRHRELVAFFERRLPAAGWEVVDRRGDVGSAVTFSLEGHGHTALVVVSGSAEATEVHIQLREDEATTDVEDTTGGSAPSPAVTSR